MTSFLNAFFINAIFINANRNFLIPVLNKFGGISVQQRRKSLPVIEKGLRYVHL